MTITKRIAVLVVFACFSIAGVAEPRDTFREIRKNYWSNNNLKTEETFVDGKLNGWTRRFRRDGTLYALARYANGKLEGGSLLFRPDGMTLLRTFYHQGLMHGPTRFYNPKGMLLMTSNYEHGQLIGSEYPLGAERLIRESQEK